MPNPRPNESKADFVSRCIPEVLAEGTAKDSAQATAICYSMYEEHKKSLLKQFISFIFRKNNAEKK
jgi:hypothetical protein